MQYESMVYRLRYRTAVTTLLLARQMRFTISSFRQNVRRKVHAQAVYYRHKVHLKLYEGIKHGQQQENRYERTCKLSCHCGKNTKSFI